MPEGGQIVAALCGNLNPFARMARAPCRIGIRSPGPVSPAGFGRHFAPDSLGEDDVRFSGPVPVGPFQRTRLDRNRKRTRTSWFCWAGSRPPH